MRISNERLAEMVASFGLDEEPISVIEIEGLARDLRDARRRITDLEREVSGFCTVLGQPEAVSAMAALLRLVPPKETT